MMANLKAAGFSCVFNLKAGMKAWCPPCRRGERKEKGHFTLCTLHTFHTSHFNTSHVRASHFSHFSTARRTLQHSFEDVALYDVALQAPPLIHASSRGCGIPEKIHLQEGKRVLKSDPVYHKGKSKPCGGPPNDEEKKSKPCPAPEKTRAPPRHPSAPVSLGWSHAVREPSPLGAQSLHSGAGAPKGDGPHFAGVRHN